MNELHFLCCDIFYFLELTLKTQVSNTMNTIGISSNNLLLQLQLMFKVPSISMHAGSQKSTPLIHCHTGDAIQVAPLLYQLLHQVVGNVGDGNFLPSFFIKKQYLSNGQASCREISHKHCK